QGNVTYLDLGQMQSSFVSFNPKRLPLSGLMFLMDHEIFSLADLLGNKEANVLQDVIIHEFTHIWHSELLDEKTRNRHSIANNLSEVGHDTQIVSNPHLAFSEGLAE